MEFDGIWIPAEAFAAAGLVGGYGVARATKKRWLGGVALGLAGVAAGYQWHARFGAGTTAALESVYLGAFGGSHPLAKRLGAWPSVFAVTAATVAASLAARAIQPSRTSR